MIELKDDELENLKEFASDLEDDDALSKSYKRAFKNYFDIGFLFVHSVNLLRACDNTKINNYLLKFDNLDEIYRLVDEYNKPIKFGKNTIYNEIRSWLFPRMQEVVNVVNYVFSRVYGEDKVLKGW